MFGFSILEISAILAVLLVAGGTAFILEWHLPPGHWRYEDDDDDGSF